MSRIPVVAGSPVVVSASAADQKTIVSQSGTILYSNTDGSGTLSSSPVTVANDTTLTVASGRGYAFVADVFGVPDTIPEASLPDSVVSTTDADDLQVPYFSEDSGRYAWADPHFYTPEQFGAVGDSSNDDTAAIQACATACIAARRRMVISPAHSHKITDTITLQAASGGAQLLLDIDGPGLVFFGLTWAGGDDKSVFKTYGWKKSKVRGLQVRLPTGADNVVVWDVDIDATRTSSGTVQWDSCHVTAAGAVTNCVGWRLGHNENAADTNATELSFHKFDACTVTMSGTVASSGNIGWVNEHPNSLHNTWDSCGVSYCQKAFTNVSTSGAGATEGGNTMFFNDCGGTGNDTEFEFKRAGVYKIQGGRWEQGRVHLSVPAGGGTTTSYEITCNGVQGTGYTDETVALFNLGAAVKLTVDTCRYFSTLGDFTSAMFTVACSASAYGSLRIRNSSLRVAATLDKFWTVGTGNWSIESDGNTYLNGSGAATAPLARYFGTRNGTVGRANRNGCYAPRSDTGLVNSTGIAMTAGRTYFTRFVPDESFTVTTFAFLVTTAAGSDDAVDVGVFSSDLTDRIGSSGSTTGKLNATTGVKTVTGLSIPLEAGKVYYGYVSMPAAFGGSAPSLACTNGVSGSLSLLLGSAVGQAEAMFKDGLSFPVPDAAVTSLSTTGGVPILGLRP